MSCFHPLLAWDVGLDSETGKHIIKILPKRDGMSLSRVRSLYGDRLMMLPCGHCVGCAQDYARMWQARIMSESEYYDKKCFITLTYNEAPENPSKNDLREFIKKLRNKFGKDIKFFGCGEKGEHTGRSHYHLILFGVDFSEDRKVITKRGLNLVYRSSTLEKLWDKGYSSFGDVDIASAGYVSKYCDKKKISSLDSGEFIMMSRGLGKRYFEEHKKEIFKSDYLYFNGNKFKLPRYFIRLAANDFYYSVLADDYCSRKREVATHFRYDKCRSFCYEEEAMIESANVALSSKANKEGIRDVI